MTATATKADFTAIVTALATMDRQPVNFWIPTLGSRTATVVINIGTPGGTRAFHDNERPAEIVNTAAFWSMVDAGRSASEINGEIQARAERLISRHQLAQS